MYMKREIPFSNGQEVEQQMNFWLSVSCSFSTSSSSPPSLQNEMSEISFYKCHNSVVINFGTRKTEVLKRLLIKTAKANKAKDIRRFGKYCHHHQYGVFHRNVCAGSSLVAVFFIISDTTHQKIISQQLVTLVWAVSQIKQKSSARKELDHSVGNLFRDIVN